MKIILYCFLLTICYSSSIIAQVNISNDNSLPHNSAMLEVKSSDKGVLVTRLTYDAIAQIANPANGLLVFCTTNNKFYVFDAFANVWREIAYGQGIITPGNTLIPGSATGNQTIGYGSIPAPLVSTPPSGGSGDYLYQWQRSFTISSFFDIFTEVTLVIQPGSAFQTTNYRLRQVDHLSHDTVYSNIVTVTVGPQLVAGVATADQSICHGTAPAMLHAAPPTGGSGNYAYQWQSGYTISSFFDVFTEISTDYQPGAITQTTYYRLKQVDTQMHDTVYTNILTVSVNPPLATGLAGDFQIIAYNHVPLPLSAQPTLGGSGVIKYQWKYHECDCGPMPCDSLECGPLCSGAPWLVIAGATNLVYTPGSLNHGKCYRMFSTDVTCNQVKGSNYVHIFVSPQLVAGVASPDQSICHGTVPAMLHASPPTGGSGNYAYQWQSGYTISSFFDIFTEISTDYQPGALTQTTYYRLRQVDTQMHDTVYSNILTIHILPPIVPGTAGPNQVIPANTVPTMLSATPPANGCGSFSYRWQYAYVINSFFDIFTETSLSYQPGTLTQSTYYRLRQIDNIGHDTVYTNPVTITIGTPSWVCGNSHTISHVAGIVAPVTKTVNYSTVTNIPGEPAKCWITRNLGASQQAASVNDATELSAGWYWQFNRKQGYKHDGLARIPNSVWTWFITENSDWTMANDPCGIELGSGWRIPTNTEWTNVITGGGWTNWTGPYGSLLKLHAAGELENDNGTLFQRGVYGFYWSGTQTNDTNGDYFELYTSYVYMNNFFKSYGYSVRCVRNQ